MASEVNETDPVGRGFVPRRIPIAVHQSDRFKPLERLVRQASLRGWNNYDDAARRALLPANNGELTEFTTVGRWRTVDKLQQRVRPEL